jgi:hypothetical protein
MDLISLFVVSGRYGLAVANGYFTTNPAIGPDRFEENDNCEFADGNFTPAATHVDLSTPFSESLTVDNPHDVDWIRFHVPGVGPQTLTLRTAPLDGAAAAEAGDIDLYVLGIPVAGSPLDIKGSSRKEGSSETISPLILDPGDYYMVVTDFAGTPIRYSLCAAVALSCNMPAGFMKTSAAPSMSRSSDRLKGAMR